MLKLEYSLVNLEIWRVPKAELGETSELSWIYIHVFNIYICKTVTEELKWRWLYTIVFIVGHYS